MIKMLLSLVKSLTITTLISSVVGLLGLLFKQSPWMWGSIAFIVQFVLFYIFNTYLQYKSIRDSKIFAYQQAQLLAQNTVVVPCANCKKDNEVLVKTNIDNKFICGHCKTKNSVYLVAESAVVTEPMYEQEPIPNTSSTNGTE